MFFFRCAFHAYADSTYAKHLESAAGGGTQSLYGTIGGNTPIPMPSSSSTPNQTTALVQMADFESEHDGPPPQQQRQQQQQSVIEVSEDSINSIEKVEEWKVLANGKQQQQNGGKRIMHNGSTPSPRENGENIHT